MIIVSLQLLKTPVSGFLGSTSGIFSTPRIFSTPGIFSSAQLHSLTQYSYVHYRQ